MLNHPPYDGSDRRGYLAAKIKPLPLERVCVRVCNRHSHACYLSLRCSPPAHASESSFAWCGAAGGVRVSALTALLTTRVDSFSVMEFSQDVSIMHTSCCSQDCRYEAAGGACSLRPRFVVGFSRRPFVAGWVWILCNWRAFEIGSTILYNWNF